MGCLYMNKFKSVFLLLLAFVVLGCEQNSDPKPIVKQDPPVVLTYKNLSGTWETYYYGRSLNGQTRLRDPGADGVTVTYDGDNKTFSETNMRNENRNNGTFKILGNDTIQFFYKVREGNVVTNKDSITEKVIIQLTEKKMVRRTIEIENGNTTEDIQIMRNLSTTKPGETPDMEKEMIDETRLLGKWTIVACRWINYNNKGPISNGEDNRSNGTYYVFFIDNGVRKFEEYLSNGERKHSGTYRIVDDVVFCFYFDPSSQKDVAVCFWLRDWKKNGNKDTFINYSKYRDNENIWLIRETRVYFEKE